LKTPKLAERNPYLLEETGKICLPHFTSALSGKADGKQPIYLSTEGISDKELRMKKSSYRSMRIQALAIAAGVFIAPVQVAAAPASASLSLVQAASNERIMRIPVCSKSVTSNCRMAGPNATWIVVGLAAAGLIVAAIASADNKPVSP
jgi:hypothetical protein